MCGITGFISYQDDLRDRERILSGMQKALTRRGPDGQGQYLTGHAALAHTRLCVIDPENGHQPMHCEHRGEQYTIVYNGELYNTSEIRDSLTREGLRFETRSDTEVILKAYAQWGEDCLDRFNGIFAFAVWAHGSETLFLARDRMGVKPLFYHRNENRLVFGSELKAVLQYPDVPHEIDIGGISQLLLFGPGRSPGCGVFRGMQELPPAHCALYSRDGLQVRRYWSLKAREHTETFAQTAEHVRFLVTDAIQRQLVSDVPLGTFLSGGLDSSLISSVAAQAYAREGRTLHTFSVDYQDNDRYFRKSKFQPNADPAYIRQMQDYLRNDHHWTVLDTPALTQALFAATEARDLPGMADVDASLLLFCKDIREHVTVALSGECADELFGGYPWCRVPRPSSCLPMPAERAKVGGVPMQEFPWSKSTDYRLSFAKPEIRAVLEERHDIDTACQQTLSDTDLLPGESPEASRMRRMMRLNTDWFMQTLLDRKDRMSMHTALEVRVPFCDYRLAEYLYNVPWEYKEHKGYEKGLLREAMRGYLPEEVLWRKKSPYPKTHNPSYLAAVTHILSGRLRDPDAPLLQILRRDALDTLLQGSDNVQWYGQLMTRPQTIAYLIQMDYWLERYQVRVVL